MKTLRERELMNAVIDGRMSRKEAEHQSAIIKAFRAWCETGNDEDRKAYYHLMGRLTPEIETWNECAEHQPVTRDNVVYDILTDAERARNLSVELAERYNRAELEKMPVNTKKTDFQQNTLTYICKLFGLSASGKKADIIARILDYIYTVQETMIVSKECKGRAAMELCFKLHINDRFAYSIVKKTASGNTQQADSCRAIVDSGYTDTLFDDIKQGINEELIRLFNDGHCHMTADGIEFDTYVTETGEYSYYINLYKAMRKVISDNKSMAYQTRRTEAIEHDNGFEAEDFTEVLHNKAVFAAFLKHLKKADAKNYHDYVTIISGIFQNADISMIAADADITERRVKYLKRKLHDIAADYFRADAVKHTCEYYKYADKSGSVLVKRSAIAESGYIDRYTKKPVWIEEKAVFDADGERVYTDKGTPVYEYFYNGQKLHSTPERGLRLFTDERVTLKAI